MVEKITQKLTDEFLKSGMIVEEQTDEYVYALTCEIESAITTGSILAISVGIGNTIPTICFLVSFFSLRKRTGGFHLNSFGSCYIGTVCIYIFIALSTETLLNHLLFVEISAVVASICIAIIGTVNHPNMHMDSTELKASRKSARLLLCIMLTVIAFIRWMDVDVAVICYSLMGIILCAILLLVAKFLGQEVK